MTKPNEKKLIGFGTILVMWLILGIVIIIWLNSLSIPNRRRTSLPLEQLQIAFVSQPPKYRLVEEIPYDAPIKTQIEYKVVLEESSDAKGIKRLLDHLLDLGIQRRGFKNHSGKSTHIFAYVYPSEEHTGINWIGMVSKIGRDTVPNFDIRNDLLNAVPAQEIKFGLLLDKRKSIFRESLTIDDTASQQAEAAYPLPDPRSPEYSSQAAESILMKQSEERIRVQKKLRLDILKRDGISEDAFYNISVEGIRSNWPQSK